MTLKTLTRLVLFALAEQRHGSIARSWGLWRTPTGDLVVLPSRPH